MNEILENQNTAFANLAKTQDAIVDKLLGRKGADDGQQLDKLSALSGLDFKQQLPVLKDQNTDYDKHWREFQSIIDCHAFGRKTVRPYDILTVYKKCLPAGSIRLTHFTTMIDRARKKNRLPHEAKAVLEEIKNRLRTVIYETPYQRKERLDKQFAALSMGRESHSAFRADWEALLEDMEDAEMHHFLADVDTLCRKYLAKLTDDLRSTVLGKNWPLDGEDKPPRKPSTWEEVAAAVDIEMASRADTKAPKEGLHGLGDGGGGGVGKLC